jgi:hypothetical protein
MVSTMSLRLCVLLSLAIPLAASDALAKRPPPADVTPVTDGDIRYEAPHFNSPCNQNGGCLVAYDNTTNAVRWFVEVYCTHYDPNLESDVQDVFITGLTMDNGQVLVTNEKGLHFAVDPATRQVSGDPTGCTKPSASACQFASARPKGRLGPIAAIGAGLFLARRRARAHR